jgi:hypothetical protein
MLKIAFLVKIVKLFHYNDAFQHLLKHMFSMKIVAGCIRINRKPRNAVNCLSGISTALRSTPYEEVCVGANDAFVRPEE